MKADRKELVKRGAELKPTIHVGKGGITDGIVDEIVKQIKDRQLVKIKILPSSEMPRKEIAAELAGRSRSSLVEVRGNTVLLCDKRLFQ
jgi:RNA-binding protein